MTDRLSDCGYRFFFFGLRPPFGGLDCMFRAIIAAAAFAVAVDGGCVVASSLAELPFLNDLMARPILDIYVTGSNSRMGVC